MSPYGNDNDDTNSNNIFLLSKTENYMLLLSRYQQKTTKIYQNSFALYRNESLYWNEYKTKSQNNNTTNKYRYFLDQNFLGVTRLFVLVYLNQDDNAKS